MYAISYHVWFVHKLMSQGCYFLLELYFVILSYLLHLLRTLRYTVSTVFMVTSRRICLPRSRSISKGVFERRTSTGSGFFSFLDSGFAHFLGQLVSIIVKTLRNTNLGASRCFKMKKTSLPVDVRRSKTLLLKLPNGNGNG